MTALTLHHPESSLPEFVQDMSVSAKVLGHVATEEQHRRAALDVVRKEPGTDMAQAIAAAFAELAGLEADAPLPAEASPFLQHAVEAREHWRQATKMLDDLRQTLTAMPEGQKSLFGRHLLRRQLPPEIIESKRQADHGAGYEVDWADWIGAPPSSNVNALSDEDLLDFLEWNLQETTRQAHDPEFRSEAEHAKINFERRLQRGVRDGVVHPDMQQKLGAFREATVYPGDVFDKMLLDNAVAYVFLDQGVIVLGQPTPESDHIFDHESVHILGRFENAMLNEAATESTALALDSTVKHGVYEHDRLVQSIIQHMSNMSLYEYSRFFAGVDGTENQESLQQEVRQRTGGLDVVGIAAMLFDREKGYQVDHLHKTNGTAHFEAAKHTAYAMAAVQQLWPHRRPPSMTEFRRFDESLQATIDDYWRRGEKEAAHAMQEGRRAVKRTLVQLLHGRGPTEVL